MSYQTEFYVVSGSGKYTGTYKLTELPWGIHNKIINACTERILGEKSMVRFDFEKYNLKLFTKGLAEAPIQINEEEVELIPKSIGDELFRIIGKLNTLTDQDRTDFLKRLKLVDSTTA